MLAVVVGVGSVVDSRAGERGAADEREREVEAMSDNAAGAIFGAVIVLAPIVALIFAAALDAAAHKADEQEQASAERRRRGRATSRGTPDDHAC